MDPAQGLPKRISPAVSPSEAARASSDYDLHRIKRARDEHHALIEAFMIQLLRAGLPSVERYSGLAGTAHAIGTLVTGSDPRTSVVDPTGKVHGMANLYVGDGSVLPRTSRVNPALTIYAWGLRLGDHLAGSPH